MSISAETKIIIHEAASTDRIYAVTRRDGFTWLFEGDTLKEVAETAEELWGAEPLSVTPFLGFLPLPKREVRP